MSNVIIGVIGVILFIGLAVAGTSWLGPMFMESRIEAEAVGYLNQTSQISHAIESYASDRGKLPVQSGREPIDILVAERYMKNKPEGGSSDWVYDGETQSLITPVAGAVDQATKICVAARVRAEMPQPERVFKCDGSDAPNGVLSSKDPCCLM